jgi:hypothetical protein
MKKGSIGGVPFLINPGVVKYNRGENWQDMGVPWVEIPTRQFTGGKGLEITCEIVLSWEYGDVEEAIKKLEKLTMKASKEEAPELILFEFGTDSYKGAITQFNYSKTKFTNELKCITARCELTFVQIDEEGGKTRLDEKGMRLWLTQTGDNFFNISNSTDVFSKERLWKAIADYNPLPDQQSIFIEANTEIMIPPGSVIIDEYETEIVKGQVPWAK